MRITPYGKTIADRPAETKATGATAHMEACQKDDGKVFLLTGKTYNGKKFQKTAQSLSGAYFTMEAVGGLQRAWHIREDGTRKLCIVR